MEGEAGAKLARGHVWGPVLRRRLCPCFSNDEIRAFPGACTPVCPPHRTSPLSTNPQKSALEREGLPGSEGEVAQACAALRSASGLGSWRRGRCTSPNQQLRPEQAVQDLHAALEEEEGEAARAAALRAMHRHILTLMKGSPGDRDVDVVRARGLCT